MYDDTQNADQSVEETQEPTANAEEGGLENLHQQTQLSSQAKEVEAQKDRNFRALREKAERAERERDEMARRLQELDARRDAKEEKEEEDDNFSIGDDEVAEGKHLSKVARKIKRLEEQLSKYQQQTTVSTTEARLKAQYPDFDTVVNKDSIDELKRSYPDIAATLNSSPDLYNTASSAYTLIKKLGIYQEDNFVADRARAQSNAAKPRPLTSVSPQQGESPLSRANAFANGLTDDLKKQLHKEMIDAIKNR